MRLYRFIDTDKKIDATVVTDGSCDQKRVFITEMRGIVPAGGLAVNEDEQAGSDALLALGFNWHVGHAVMHEELVAFAENNGLTLTINQIDEGGKSVSVNLTPASVITYDYTLTATPTSLSFANTGETKSFSVVSTKQKKLNGNVSGSAVDVAFSFEVAGSGFSKSTGNNVVATENTTESERTGVVTITQSESDEVDTINLSQTAATVTYDYTLTTDPTSLSFVAAGETKVFDVTSNKQKKVNGKNSGSPIVVDYTTVVSGEGFTKGSSEYSVIAAANTGAERTGQAVVTANEGGKTATITLTQLGV